VAKEIKIHHFVSKLSNYQKYYQLFFCLKFQTKKIQLLYKNTEKAIQKDFDMV
jgi:hypothetical protein